MDSNYDACLKRLLIHEGTYGNHPSDPGGPTNWGITIKDARMYWKKNATALDVRNMPLSVARGIYRTRYWGAMRCADLPSGVDNCVFDYGVNSGNSRAIKVFQRVLGVTADGIIGNATLAAARAQDPDRIIDMVCDERMRFLRALGTWHVFGVGWARRVAEVRAYSHYLVSIKGGMVVATPPTILEEVTPGKGTVPPPALPPLVQGTSVGAIAGLAAVSLVGVDLNTVLIVAGSVVGLAGLVWVTAAYLHRQRQDAPA